MGDSERAIEDSLVQHPMNIPVGHLQRLREMAEEQERPMQEIVRESVEATLIRYDKRKKKRGTKGSG